MGQFVDVRPIHRGLSSWIVRAVRVADGQATVLKVPARTEADDVARRRLLREWKILRGLDAEGVVRAVALHEHPEFIGSSDDPLVFAELAMELMDAGVGTLEARLANGPLALDVFFRVAGGLTRALTAVHARGLTHGEVKPGNVVLQANGTPTLVDFGSATSQSEVLASRGSLLGTEAALAYVSPEQTGRMGRAIDDRTDLYSLGVTLYEALVGKVPFDHRDPMAQLHAHLARAPVPVSNLRDDLPPGLSAVLSRLLEKLPEQRYQTASALNSDLERIEASSRGPDASTFELSAGEPLRDRSPRFRLPQRRYGPRDVLDHLEGLWSRAALGPRHLALVVGSAGAGKTTLGLALQVEVAAARGLFALGKFEEFSRRVPFFGIAAALSELTRQILGSSEATLSRLRVELAERLGPARDDLTEFLPELGVLLGANGPQRATLAPAPVGSRLGYEGRLGSSILTLLSGLAAARRPLCIVLDDLHWADPASLRLLQRIVETEALKHVLLVGTLRDDALQTDAALRTWHARVTAHDDRVSEVSPPPLELEAIAHLCADALQLSVLDCRPLARVGLGKTEGNPLYIRQWLKVLHDRGYLHFDHETRRFVWDLEAIGRTESMENVVDLLTHRLGALPEGPRRLLQVAAVAGSKFEGSVLEILGVGGLLDEALQVSLDLAVDTGFLVSVTAPAADAQAYRFVHDRIRQAALNSLTADELADLHGRMARHVLNRGGWSLPAELSAALALSTLFDATDHLLAGPPPVNRDETYERFVLCNAAGRRAMRAQAYRPACTYLEFALEFAVAADVSAPERRACLRCLAECAFVVGDVGRAEALLEETLAAAEDPVERSEVYALRVVQCTSAGDYERSLDWAERGLRLVGVDLPTTDPSTLAVVLRAEMATIEVLLAGVELTTLSTLPVMTGPLALSTMKLLSVMGPAAYFTRPDLVPFTLARQVYLTLSEGRSAHAGTALAGYAMFVADRQGDHAKAVELAFAGVALARADRDDAKLCKTLQIAATTVLHWGAMSLAETAELLREAIELGRGSGEIQYENYAGLSLVSQIFAQGVHLDLVSAEIARAMAVAHESGDHFTACALTSYAVVVASLRTGGDEVADWSTQASAARRNPTGHFLHAVAELRVALIGGDSETALRLASELESVRPHAVGLFALVEHDAFAAIAACQVGRDFPGSTETFTRHAPRVLRWSRISPRTASHLARWVEAERADFEGDVAAAMVGFDEAAELARAHGFLGDRATIFASASRFYRRRGRGRIATTYVRAAIEAFGQWGALEVVRVYEEAWGSSSGRFEVAHLTSQPSNSSSTLDHRQIDLTAVVAAVEAVTSEVQLERLLTRLMHHTMEAAGASRGGVILESTGEGAPALRVYASVVDTAGGRIVVHTRDVPLDEQTEVPASVIHRVRRSRRLFSAGDALEAPETSSDEAVLRLRPRSVMALPMVHQGRLCGVLYLDNDLVPGVFAAQQLDTLGVLTNLLAVAVENGRALDALHREVAERERAEARLRQLNLELEAHVEGRIAELASANAELGRSNAELAYFAQMVSHDLREPLRMVSSFGDLLVRRCGETLDEKGRHYVAQMVSGAARMQGLVHELGLQAKVGQGVGRMRDVSLDVVLKEALLDLAMVVEATGAVLSLGPLPIVFGDAVQLRQVFEKVLGHAMKHRGQRAPRLVIDAVVSEGDTSDSGFVTLRVCDDRGLETTESGQFTGGPGLDMVRRIVSRHGGRTWVDLTPSGGARFNFSLPGARSR